MTYVLIFIISTQKRFISQYDNQIMIYPFLYEYRFMYTLVLCRIMTIYYYLYSYSFFHKIKYIICVLTGSGLEFLYFTLWWFKILMYFSFYHNLDYELYDNKVR